MNNQKALRLLKKYCEQVKIELSNNLEANIDIDRLAEGYDFELNIHRTDFEDCCQDLFDKCFPPITQALEDANLQKEDIDEIVLVGGSTRIPKIQEKLKEYFNGKELSKKINSDEAVAEGATIQAQLIKDGKINDIIKFIDINPISLGIGGGYQCKEMVIMIPKNTPIPFKITNRRQTLHDNQTMAKFPVYQGEGELTKDNYYLDEITINGLRKAPAGKVKFNVTMEMDENGILKVDAQEIDGKLHGEIRIESVNNLKKEQINKFKEQEFNFEYQDLMNKQRAKAIQNLKNYINEQKEVIKNYEKIKKELILKKFKETENFMKDMNLNSIDINNKKIELESYINNL